MDNLLSPFSNLSTPLHHPDEDLQTLTNFQHQQNSNVYLPKQMSFAPPPLMMPQPQTPVCIALSNMNSVFLTNHYLNFQQSHFVPMTPATVTPSVPDIPKVNTPAVDASPMMAMTPMDSSILPQLQNIVSTVNLNCKLDLKKIALHARNAEYNPKRFAAVIMRIREPRTTALIFSSGKMVCTGAKSEDDSRLAARKYARIIQKLGFNAKFLDFKIQNMVGSCDVKFPIRLEGLVLTHSKFSSYEPELFPGLIYR